MIGVLSIAPSFAGPALAFQPTPLVAAPSVPAGPAPALAETPAASAPPAFSSSPEPSLPLTPTGPSVEADSAEDALHQLLARSIPRDNQDPLEPARGDFAPVPLADTDQNDIQYARWMNGSSQWTGESVNGRTGGGFQRDDVDWWMWTMGNVTSGSGDVMEFDVQKEPGEQLYIEVRVFPNFEYRNFGGPNTYYTAFWENANSTQGWGYNSHITVTAFEANTYFLYIRSPPRNTCCMVNYSILNVTQYMTSSASIDDNSNRTSADVFNGAAMPVDQEVEQNADMVDVFDLTSQFTIVPSAGDTARINLNLSITGGRNGMSDFYNQTQSPAVTSWGDTLSAAGLILFYPDTRGIWHSYTDAGFPGDTLAINGVINGTPLYAAVYTFSVINVPVSPLPASSVPGMVTYNFTGFWRTEDHAPSFLSAVPNVAMWEDDVASGQDLVDLAPFFSDDWDSGQLRYGIRYNQQPTLITPSVTGSMLSVAPISANYWGNVTIQVLGYDRGFDRIPATADDHATSSNFFVVNVRPVNDPPVLSAIGGQQNLGAPIEFKMVQNASLAITPTVTDADGAGGFMFSVDTLPPFATFDAGAGTLTFRPLNADVGIHTLTETVSDGTATASVSLIINVSNINDNPYFVRAGGINVADFPHSFSGRQGDLFSILLEVEDPDWTIAFQPPDNLNFAANRNFVSVVRDPVDWQKATATFTPTNAQVGVLTITFSVTDGALGAFDDNLTVTVVVQNANDAPYLTSLGTTAGVWNITGETQLALAGFDGARQELDFVMTVRADDIDVAAGHGDALSFSTDQPQKFRVVAKPDGVSAEITVKPNQTDAARGFMDFVITVTDQGVPGLAASISMHVTVANINDNPVWTPVFSVNLTEGVAYAQAFTAMDPDGDPISYTSDSLIFTVDPATGAVEFTPTNELIEGADYQVDVTFTARDNHNGVSVMLVHFFIANVNGPPTSRITAPLDASSFGPGEGISARGAGEDLDAEDRDHLAFKWFVDDVAVANTATALITVANPEVADKTVTIRLQVTDTHGLSSNASVTVTVRGTPAPPAQPGFDAAFAVAAAAIAALAAVVARKRR